MSWVPLPWCTSQSTIATRLTLIGELCRGHGDVVEQTEPHGAVGHRMVPRRAAGGERNVTRPRLQRVDGVEHGPRRASSRGPRSRRGERVRIQVTAAEPAEPLELSEIRRIVHSTQLGDGCEAGFVEGHGVEQIRLGNARQRRVEASRAFRMPVRREVFVELRSCEHGNGNGHPLTLGRPQPRTTDVTPVPSRSRRCHAGRVWCER